MEKNYYKIINGSENIKRIISVKLLKLNEKYKQKENNGFYRFQYDSLKAFQTAANTKNSEDGIFIEYNLIVDLTRSYLKIEQDELVNIWNSIIPDTLR